MMMVPHLAQGQCMLGPRAGSQPVSVGRGWGGCSPYATIRFKNTVRPVLAVISIKQPTCLKQPNKMFPDVKFVLIFTSV